MCSKYIYEFLTGKSIVLYCWGWPKLSTFGQKYLLQTSKFDIIIIVVNVVYFHRDVFLNIIIKGSHSRRRWWWGHPWGHEAPGSRKNHPLWNWWGTGSKHSTRIVSEGRWYNPVQSPSFPRQCHGRNLRNCHNISVVPNRTSRFKYSPVPYFTNLINTK